MEQGKEKSEKKKKIASAIIKSVTFNRIESRYEKLYFTFKYFIHEKKIKKSLKIKIESL